jgi:hypothetical protein
MCENSFLCYTSFSILGQEIKGVGLFFSMIFVGFWLQIASNFVGLWRNQLTRETLKENKESDARHKFIIKSVFWMFISTVLWILRVVLIIGNNVWIFGTILIGNVLGHLWALTVQHADVKTGHTEASVNTIKNIEKNKLIL